MTRPALKRFQKGDGDWALVALIVALAVTFCGTPDLHDALMSHVTVKCPTQPAPKVPE